MEFFNLEGFSPSDFAGFQIFTATSDDMVNWEEWKEVIDGVIQSSLKRYLKWKIIFGEWNSYSSLPYIDEVSLAWNTGGGETRWNGIGLELLSDDINELPITFSDEYEGKKTQFNKVEVQVNKYFLQAVDKVWESETGWIAETGKTYNYNPLFSNPVEIDDDYKLKINGYYYPEGESTYGNLTVNFTRHPVKPRIEITASADTEITEFFIEGKSWEQSSPKLYYAGEGDRVKTITSKYLSSGELAQKIANNTYLQLKDIKGNITRAMKIGWCPTINFRDLIKVSNTDFGITKLYQVIGLTFDFNVLGNLRAETRIRCKEVSLDIFYDPLYWEGRINGQVIYWGSKDGVARYRGGRMYG